MKRFRNKMKEHVNNCSCLKKIKKDDFDQFISDQPLYNESDKIKFRYTIDGKKSKRRFIPQVVMATVILGVFILLIQTTMEPTNSNPNREPIAQEDEQEQIEEDKVIDEEHELDFNTEHEPFNEEMGLDELGRILNNYRQKLSELEELKKELKDEFDYHLYSKIKASFLEKQDELYNLISQKRDEAYEWTIYETEEQLQEHFYKIIPGLKRADELGFVEEVNQTFDLDHELYDFRIDKSWYNSDGWYVFYSYNINEAPVGPVNYNFHLNHDTHLLRGKWRGKEDVIYNGRIYNAIKFEPLDWNGPKLDDINGLFTFDIDLSFEGERFNLENQQIPIVYREEEMNQYAFNVPINKTFREEGFELTLDHLEYQLGGNDLYFNYDDYKLQGLVSEVNGEEVYASNRDQDKHPGIFKFPIRASDELPETLDINLKYLNIITDQMLRFDVDTSGIEYQETVDMNEFVGELYGIRFYIDHLTFDRDGLEVMLRHEEPKDSKIQYEIKSPPSMPGPTGEYTNSYNQLKLEDENGEELNYSNLSTLANPENDLIGFTVPGNGEKVVVTISNLLLEVILNEKMKIDFKQ